MSISTTTAALAALALIGAAGAAEAQATVYQHCGYGGYAAQVSEGYNSLTTLTNRGMKNDDVSSVRVTPGYEVTLWEDAGQRGRKRVLTESASCLHGFNDIVSSISVRKLPPQEASATLYQHCGYGGYAIPIGEGYHSLTDLMNRGMENDDVSSIRVAPGSQVTIYEDFRKLGSFRVITEDTSCLSGFNDVLSSAVVEKKTAATQAFNFGVNEQCVSNVFGTGIVAHVSWYHPSEIVYNAAKQEFSTTADPRQENTITLGFSSCITTPTRMVAVVKVKDGRLARGAISVAVGTVVSATGAAICAAATAATGGAAAPAACPGATIAAGAIIGTVLTAIPNAADVFYIGAARDLSVYGTVFEPKYTENKSW